MHILIYQPRGLQHRGMQSLAPGQLLIWEVLGQESGLEPHSDALVVNHFAWLPLPRSALTKLPLWCDIT